MKNLNIVKYAVLISAIGFINQSEAIDLHHSECNSPVLRVEVQRIDEHPCSAQHVIALQDPLLVPQISTLPAQSSKHSKTVTYVILGTSVVSLGIAGYLLADHLGGIDKIKAWWSKKIEVQEGSLATDPESPRHTLRATPRAPRSLQALRRGHTPVFGAPARQAPLQGGEWPAHAIIDSQAGQEGQEVQQQEFLQEVNQIANDNDHERSDEYDEDQAQITQRVA